MFQCRSDRLLRRQAQACLMDRQVGVVAQGCALGRRQARAECPAQGVGRAEQVGRLHGAILGLEHAGQTVEVVGDVESVVRLFVQRQAF